MPADDPHRRLIERYIAAYNAFDVPGMIALLDPDVTFENVSGGQVTAAANGREELRALAEHAATLFTSRCQTIRWRAIYQLTRQLPPPMMLHVSRDRWTTNSSWVMRISF
jgi:ketosteroid isomerase-like protein